MIKNLTTFAGGIIILIVLAFITGAFYIVDETKQAVITQFGMPIGAPITESGLHFKIPLIRHVQYFEKRLLAWDGDPNQIPTLDKKYIWLDTTARWKISNALLFLQSVGSERGAHARLDDIINSATRDEITNHLLVEVIRNSNRVLETKIENEDMMAEEALGTIDIGRKVIEENIIEKAGKLAPQYGIEIVDVRIKRVDYVEDVRRKVYERMISERKRAAEQYRSEGKGKSAEIRGKMEKELKNITSEAYKEAQGIRGKADAEATRIYAEAFNKDPEFYEFLRTLETYRTTIGQNTTVLLSTDSDYFKYLKKMK